MRKFETTSPEETFAVGQIIAKDLYPGAVVALVGDLGCGKTAFVKGVTAYFGEGEQVVSPTFTLVNEYDGEVPIYHFDVYRLENPSLEECDWMDDYLFGDGICLIEWADNIREILPENTLRIEFAKDPQKGENYREITIC
ncbi:MAG: tRNA (adenosine(37)-N6)-threonylcarbamoyltransferase complex ATPase subunit type 1 TsaE [Clostridia bacterium]|nr:tRNA (adenosine(37)-N6)-threonylcarbamoyltransferase complex ATPase subunit type 1 TsaE [Clostridia bacterium]